MIPIIIFGQIEKQVRDDNPGLFKNQRLFHSIPKPFFKSRSHNLDFITNVPEDSVVSATLFFKTNLMEHYQEFSLGRSRGTYSFKYYFIIETKNKIYGVPINDDGELSPVNKLLVDPVEHFKQKTRLNQ